MLTMGNNQFIRPGPPVSHPLWVTRPLWWGGLILKM